MHYISKDLMAPDAADNLLDKMKVEIRTKMGNGITMSADEAQELYKILKNIA